MGMASNTIIILLGSLAMLHSLPLLHALPNRSTTVHRILPGGRVKSHGGFLGGYGFKITGLTRSYAEPDFVLRSRQQQPQQQQQQPQESDGLEVVEQLSVEAQLPEVEEKLPAVSGDDNSNVNDDFGDFPFQLVN